MACADKEFMVKRVCRPTCLCQNAVLCAGAKETLVGDPLRSILVAPDDLVSLVTVASSVGAIEPKLLSLVLRFQHPPGIVVHIRTPSKHKCTACQRE